MKRILFAALTAVSCVSLGDIPSEEFLDVLAFHESSFRTNAVGAAGERGLFQLSRKAVDAVNESVDEEVYRFPEDAEDPVTAYWITLEYFDLISNEYKRKHGLRRNLTWEEWARLWNGGPRGMSKISTRKYWERFQESRAQLKLLRRKFPGKYRRPEPPDEETHRLAEAHRE